MGTFERYEAWNSPKKNSSTLIITSNPGINDIVMVDRKFSNSIMVSGALV